MSLSSCLEYLPQTWWLHIGDRPKKNVLVCGYLDEFSLKFLSEISQSVFLFSCDLTMTPKNNLTLVEKGELKNYEYDSIIINQYSNEALLTKIDLFFLINNFLGENGTVCLYEHSESFYSLFRKPFHVLLNIFYDRRKYEFEVNTNMKYIKHFETISYGNRPHESHINGVYFTNKNTFLLKEKFKSYLFNSPFSRLFTNTSIWVMCKKNTCPNMLNKLEQFVQSTPDIPWEGSKPEIIKIYYKSGKIIFSLTSRRGSQPEYIVVIAFNAASILQRDNEKKIINYLQKKPQLSSYVCDYYFDAKFGNSKIYLMTELSGVTVDIDNNNLMVMTERAVAVLNVFTKLTILVDRNEFLSDLLQSYIAILKKRLPDYLSDILLIEGYIKKSNIQSIPSVFMHGDMKLENFVLDKTNHITGLIDFELSEIEGFPLLDLLYLITYNLQTRKGYDFSHAFWALFKNKTQLYEQNLVNNYCNQYMLSSNQKKLLLVVFFMHHYSQRSKINVHFEKELLEIESSLKCVKEIINLAAG
ncbi:MAG: aminoglycoside phosphotransferase family protein [Gammaproteobacteria bacterium]|jgi:thiamine kinase-like enzyme|nr:aminoglycoside phosphotransferase family protein [Gammaproteobacteria bacterium]